MTLKDFLILILIGLVVYMFLEQPPRSDPQRASQPLIQPTAVYHIDTSQPATVVYIDPVLPTVVLPTATPYPTATAVPTATSDGTPEPQRAEQGNERGCASTRSCGP